MIFFFLLLLAKHAALPCVCVRARDRFRVFSIAFSLFWFVLCEMDHMLRRCSAFVRIIIMIV